MLIDPAGTDPATSIGFREEVAFPIGNDPRARTTIEVLGLNRDALVEVRFDHLKPYLLLRRRLASLPANDDEARDIRALFEEAVLPRAPYSSMVRALLTGVA